MKIIILYLTLKSITSPPIGSNGPCPW